MEFKDVFVGQFVRTKQSRCFITFFMFSLIKRIKFHEVDHRYVMHLRTNYQDNRPNVYKRIEHQAQFFSHREFSKNCSGLGTVLCRHQGGVPHHFLSFISISIKLSSDSLWTVCDQYAKTDGSTFDKFVIVGGKMKSGCPKNAENQRS